MADGIYSQHVCPLTPLATWRRTTARRATRRGTRRSSWTLSSCCGASWGAARWSTSFTASTALLGLSEGFLSHPTWFPFRVSCGLRPTRVHSIFQNGILRNRMGAAAARSGAPCVPTATPGPWDIPPAIGDAWFIHYPIYTGCVAARLETRSAAQRADHKTDQKTAVATPAL